MHRDIEEILISEEALSARVHEMGKLITEHFADTASEDGILVISVLRGAAIFVADLVRCIDLPLEMDYMALSSYGNEATSSGRVRIDRKSTRLNSSHAR